MPRTYNSATQSDGRFYRAVYPSPLTELERRADIEAESSRMELIRQADEAALEGEGARD